MNTRRVSLFLTLAVALGSAADAHARATDEELAQIGTRYTCTGAEMAGTPEGVAPFTGRHLGAMPGMAPTAENGERPQDPYAAEKPLFTITAGNMAKYAEFLTPGQQAMFRKYPSFRMEVYPSHRDFRYDDAVCHAALHNARNATLEARETKDEAAATRSNQWFIDRSWLKVHGAVPGAVPFPFPKNGKELVWNLFMAPRPSSVMRETDVAAVYPNGNVLWGAQRAWNYAPLHDARLRRPAYDGVAEYRKAETLAPAREAGTITWYTQIFSLNDANSIVYLWHSPDYRHRRYRLGPDSPIPPTANTITEDEIRLLTPGHENPDFVRWELRRAWVLDGRLRQKYRHLYPHRTLYIDEDSYQATMSEAFDAKDGIWRFNWANNLYVGGTRTNTWETYSAYYHDLLSGGYTAYDLTQGRPKSLVIDAANAEYGKPEFYEPEKLLSMVIERFINPPGEPRKPEDTSKPAQP